MSYSADGAPESASKKLAMFADNPVAEIRVIRESIMPDAAEKASAAVESPKKKRKVVSDESRPERKRSRPRWMLRRQRRKPIRPGSKRSSRVVFWFAPIFIF